MDMPAPQVSEPTLLQELRSSLMLFAVALGTTGGTVVATRLLLRVLG
jgi:hypothetical protein